MPENQKFCQHCGQPLSAGARFCEGCGLAVPSGPVVEAPPPFSSPTPPPPGAGSPVPTVSPPPRGFLPWLIGGLAFLAIIGVIGGYYWGKSSGSSPVSDPQVQQIPPNPPAPPPSRKPGPEHLPPGPTTSAPGAFTQATPDLSWPWTSQRPVTPADLEGMSLMELELMRNEIYARRGWVFQRDDLRAFFESQPWYRAQGNLDNRDDANRYVEKDITPLERRNIKTILEYEKRLRQ